LFERDILGRLLETLLDIGAWFQPPGLRRNQTEHHDLVALWKETQRLETAGTIGVVFEEVTVVVALCEKILRHRLAPARAHACRTKICPTERRGGRQCR